MESNLSLSDASSEKDNYSVIRDIYRCYYASMIRQAKRYVVNTWDAEDVVSNCYLSLMRHTELMAQMETPVLIKYIMVAVRNEALNLLRKRSRHEMLPLLDDHISLSCGADPLARLIYSDTVMHLLSALTEREAKVAIYKLQRYPVREIALNLAVTETSIRVLWWRARQKMKLTIQNEN